MKKAQKARCLQGMIGNPTECEFEGMVREKLIANYPVTVRDIQNAHQIFGPDLANLRGKTTRTKPDIRSAKQDDKYGASNIILPCSGS
jgi:hypothetical protein